MRVLVSVLGIAAVITAALGVAVAPAWGHDFQLSITYGTPRIATGYYYTPLGYVYTRPVICPPPVYYPSVLYSPSPSLISIWEYRNRLYYGGNYIHETVIVPAPVYVPYTPYYTGPTVHYVPRPSSSYRHYHSDDAAYRPAYRETTDSVAPSYPTTTSSPNGTVYYRPRYE